MHVLYLSKLGIEEPCGVFAARKPFRVCVLRFMGPVGNTCVVILQMDKLFYLQCYGWTHGGEGGEYEEGEECGGDCLCLRGRGAR